MKFDHATLLGGHCVVLLVVNSLPGKYTSQIACCWIIFYRFSQNDRFFSTYYSLKIDTHS